MTQRFEAEQPEPIAIEAIESILSDGHDALDVVRAGDPRGLEALAVYLHELARMWTWCRVVDRWLPTDTLDVSSRPSLIFALVSTGMRDSADLADWLTALHVVGITAAAEVCLDDALALLDDPSIDESAMLRRPTPLSDPFADLRAYRDEIADRVKEVAARRKRNAEPLTSRCFGLELRRNRGHD